MVDAFKCADDFGPLKVIHIYESSANLKAVLVSDNIARAIDWGCTDGAGCHYGGVLSAGTGDDVQELRS